MATTYGRQTTWSQRVVQWQGAFRERTWRIRQAFYAFNSKILIAYAMLLACGFTADRLSAEAPIWPPSRYTPAWVLAFFFPISAVLYSVFKLHIRCEDIRYAFRRHRLHRIFIDEDDDSRLEGEFSRFLLRRAHEYYNPWELMACSWSAAAVAIMAELLLLKGFAGPLFGTPLAAVAGTVDGLVNLLGPSFLGALCGGVVMIFKHYRNFDIYPATYLHVAVALVVGTIGPSFLLAVYPASATAFLAFATGLLIALNIDFLPRLVRYYFAKLTGAPTPDELKTDLDRVLKNGEAIETLNSISLFSVAEFIETEPVRLYLNMPQPIGVIHGWMDEALLHYYFGARAEALKQRHIHRFTQLMELVAEDFAAPAMRWRRKVRITGDPEVDEQIRSTVATAVETRNHHRLLGLLSVKYRCAFFEPAVATSKPVVAPRRPRLMAALVAAPVGATQSRNGDTGVGEAPAA